MNFVGASCQPVAKDEAVKRPQDQSFRTTGRTWNDANILRAQAVLRDVLAGAGAGMDAQGFHVAILP